MENNWKIGAIAGLDGTQSRNQLNSDIKGLARNLDKLKLYAEIDKNQVIQLQNQLKKLQIDLNTVTVTDAAINGLVQKINAGLQNITIGNINVGGVGNQSQQVGQQIGNNIAQGVANGVNKAKSELKSFSDLTNFSELNKKIEHLQIDPSALKNYNAILDEVKTKYAEFGQVKITNEQFNNGVLEKFKVNIEQVNGDLKETKSFMMALNDDKDTFVFDGIIKGSESVVQHLDKTKNAVNQTADAINALKDKAKVDKIQLSMSTGGYESKVDSLIGKTQQWVDANGNARISTDALQTAMNNLNTAYANITATGGNTVANQQALIQAEKALDVEVKKVQSSVTSMNATMAKSTAVDSLRQKVQQFYDINTKSHRKYGVQLRAIISELASGAEVPITKLRQLSQEFIGIQNSARRAGKLGLSFFDTLKQGMKSFSYWTSSTFLVMKTIQEVRQVITNVKELDNAMMDLTMATGYNKNQVEELMDTYFKLGEELSATATDVAASADTWLRQGKSIAETNELIKDSMILSKISGLSAEESTKYLTSAMKGYKVATEDVLGVVDKLSAVDMASATDVGGLAEGMSEVAASADLAGVSMDKLLGYLAIVGETTQSGMSEVGTSFNAIFARMGNIKLARLKDYQNSGEDLSNVETVLRGEGIVLRDSVNEFRNFGEVLDEVAGRWTSFSEVSQRAIASAFAGTHHMNEFIILMENYGKAVEYSEISMESSGKAMEKFASYEDTITAHTEKFKNAYQEMSKELLDSSVVKAFVDLGTGATKLVKELGLLGSIGLGAGIFAGIKNVGQAKMSACLIYAYPC